MYIKKNLWRDWEKKAVFLSKPEFVRSYKLAGSARQVQQKQMHRELLSVQKRCKGGIWRYPEAAWMEEEGRNWRIGSTRGNSLPQTAERSRTRCHWLKHLKYYLHLAKEYVESVLALILAVTPLQYFGKPSRLLQCNVLLRENLQAPTCSSLSPWLLSCISWCLWPSGSRSP